MLSLYVKQKDLLWNDNSDEWTLSSERGVENSSPMAGDRQKHVKEITLIEPTEENGPSLAKQKRSNARGLVKNS